MMSYSMNQEAVAHWEYAYYIMYVWPLNYLDNIVRGARGSNPITAVFISIPLHYTVYSYMYMYMYMYAVAEYGALNTCVVLHVLQFHLLIVEYNEPIVTTCRSTVCVLGLQYTTITKIHLTIHESVRNFVGTFLWYTVGVYSVFQYCHNFLSQQWANTQNN